MSELSITTLRAYYEAGNRGDFQTALEALSPEFTFHTAGVFPDLEAVYHGRDGFQKFIERFVEPWQELSVDPQELVDAHGKVLVPIAFHARGRDGIEAKFPMFHLWTLEDGLAIRLEAFADEREARLAAGL